MQFFKVVSVVFLAIFTLVACSSKTEEQEKLGKNISSEYLPKDYTIKKFAQSDDGKFLQIITDNYYESENIPNLYSFLNNKKEKGEIKDFEVDTYQLGLRTSNGRVLVVIQK